MTREARNVKNCAGFSLLEVVVAFVILAVTLGTLYQIFSLAAQRAVLVQEYSHAVLLADAKLTEVADVSGAASEAGELDEKYRWERRVEPLALQDGSTGQTSLLVPYRVTVEVRWGQSEGQRSIALTTVRLGRRG